MSSSNVVAIKTGAANRGPTTIEPIREAPRPSGSVSTESDPAAAESPLPDANSATTSEVCAKLVIDPVVRSWLPGRSAAELAWLNQSTPDVASNPILVFRRGEEYLVLENADLVERCQQLGIEPKVQLVELASLEEAHLFVLDRQLSRPQLSGLRLHYVRGSRYCLERAPGHRSDLETSPQTEGKSRAKRETRWGCSTATIERDGRLSRMVDQAAETHGYEARVALLDPRNKLTAKHVERFHELSLAEQREVLDALTKGEDSGLLRVIPGASDSNAVSDTAELRLQIAATFAQATKSLGEVLPSVKRLILMDAGEKAFVGGQLARIAQNFAALCAATQNDAARDTSVTIGDVQTALLQINEISAALDAREENEKNGARRRSQGGSATVTSKPTKKACRDRAASRP